MNNQKEVNETEIYAFFSACYNNELAEVKKYIKGGVEPKVVINSGSSALLVSCQGNSVEVASFLLQQGVDPNQRFTKTSQVDGRIICDNGCVILYAKSVEMIDLLLKAGADLQVKDGTGRGVEDWWSYFPNGSDLISRYLPK